MGELRVSRRFTLPVVTGEPVNAVARLRGLVSAPDWMVGTELAADAAEGFEDPKRWLSGLRALALLPHTSRYVAWLEAASAVVDEVSSPELLEAAAESGPAYQIVLIDAFLTAECGVAVAERIATHQPWSRVFIVAPGSSGPVLQRTRQLANAQVVTCNLSEADFVLQVVSASRGTAALLQSMARQVARRSKLSPQQERLLWLNLWGYSDQEIAHALGIQLHTVQDYQLTLRRKTGVRSKAGYLRLLLEYLGTPAPLEQEPSVQSGLFPTQRRSQSG